MDRRRINSKRRGERVNVVADTRAIIIIIVDKKLSPTAFMGDVHHMLMLFNMK